MSVSSADVTTTIWRELGIEPTKSIQEIKRAYAKRLKQCRPDNDPAGFAILREAYESALKRAEAGTAKEVSAEPEAAPSDQARPVALKPTAEPPRRSEDNVDDLYTRFGDALASQQYQTAFDLFIAARDARILPLQAELGMSDQLLVTMLRDPAVDAGLLRGTAEQCGWPLLADAAPDSIFAHLVARLDAEAWLENLRVAAASKRLYVGDELTAAARLLLGAGPVRGLSPWLPPVPPLRMLLAELKLHWRWIGQRFDADRLNNLTTLANRPYPGKFAKTLLATSFLFAVSTITSPLAMWSYFLAFYAGGLGGVFLVRTIISRVRGVRALLLTSLGFDLVGIALVVSLCLDPTSYFAENVRNGFGRAAGVAGIIALSLGWQTLKHRVTFGGLSPRLVAVVAVVITSIALAIANNSGLLSLDSPSPEMQARQFAAWRESLPESVRGLGFSRPSAPAGGVKPARGSPEWIKAQQDAATRGDPLASMLLGQYLVEESLAEPDQKAARKLVADAVPLLEQAEPTYLAAGYTLGELYETGDGVPKSVSRAREYYSVGDVSLDPKVGLRLAEMRLRGVGGPVDVKGALQLYRSLAKHGSATAARSLGMAYLAGDTLPRNSALAEALLTSAAEAGDAQAMAALAHYDLSAGSTNENAIAAYRWLRLAALSSGDTEAKGHDFLRDLQQATRRLGESQRSKVDLEIGSWHPVPFAAPPELSGPLPIRAAP